ncbi:hypothetical protein L2449_27265 [Mesorhizobium muleiense]|uniref:hypothetical protein n=1 Tax=Mesorhizobium muleiense TaxID=1004279 RepID=UPI001F472051|nr:hypothetical protein [Mesorhizobium muleiense]MCF6120528.1 hypothetical protein [Mesorhizobium muleiense]
MAKLTPGQIKAISDKIHELLPDDPHEALAVMALSFACVSAATHCADEDALNAVRIALRQMHAHGVGLDG